MRLWDAPLIVVCLFGLLLSLATRAVGVGTEFAGGTGEPGDPYQVATAEQLVSIGADPNLLDRHFVLVSDIDLDPNKPGGRIFGEAVIAPDPDPDWRVSGPSFSGRFDGAGHTIRNLRIHADSGARVGLFGTVGSLGGIHDLGLENAAVIVTGRSDHIGTVVGWSEGAIVRCWATGRLRGQEQSYDLGGLVGRLEGGTVRACFADVDVSGHFHLGGLVGGNHSGTISHCYAAGDILPTRRRGARGGLVGVSTGTVSRCYAVGKVPVGEYSSEFGGLIGRNAGTAVKDCFWNVQTSGLQISKGGTGLTTVQMMDPRVYSLNGWAGDPNWVLDGGHDYPHLVWEGTVGRTLPAPVIDWFAGKGTEAAPYVVATPNQLALIGTASVLWKSHFVLADDVNLAGVDVPPIGFGSKPFKGSFNGHGKVIRHLVVDVGDAAVSHLGLFGALGSEGCVSNLAVEDAVIRGGDCSHNLGILAGSAALATITDCRVTGHVSAGDKSQSLGGLVGGAFDATIRDCRVICEVSAGQGSKQLGGLAGYYGSVNAGIVHAAGTPGEVDRCRVSGTISAGNASQLVGGFVGYNLGGTVSVCHASVHIRTANECKQLGGLTGYNRDGRISDSYASGSIRMATDAEDIGGLVGYFQYGSVTRCYAVVPIVTGTAGGSVGGLVGGASGNDVTNSFWDTQVSGTPESMFGTGMSTAQMQIGSTYVDAGWDFETVWRIGQEGTYPYLRWEGFHRWE